LTSNVRVFGDSQLVIKAMLGVYKKVRKASLYTCIQAVKTLVSKRGWTVTYRNLPREYNVVADAMCREALALTDSQRVEYWSPGVSGDAPHTDLAAIYSLQGARGTYDQKAV
jgi:ribonuclease HI